MKSIRTSIKIYGGFNNTLNPYKYAVIKNSTIILKQKSRLITKKANSAFIFSLLLINLFKAVSVTMSHLRSFSKFYSRPHSINENKTTPTTSATKSKKSHVRLGSQY